MSTDTDDFAEPFRRTLEQVFAWGSPPPIPPDGLADELRAFLTERLMPDVSRLTRLAESTYNRRLLLTKSKLSRLACDGWQNDPLPYTHNWNNVRGVLVHAVIAQDLREQRQRDVLDVVRHVWRAHATDRPGDPASLAAWLNSQSRDDAKELADQICQQVLIHRNVWPLIDVSRAQLVPERTLEAVLPGLPVALRGVPDLVVNSTTRDQAARSVVIDWKTGLPRPENDRADARFYALLFTLATGTPPKRWATFYIAEGRAEVEEFRVDALFSAAAQCVATAAQLLRLAAVKDGNDEDDLFTLRGGSWCRFCARQTHCEQAVLPDATITTAADDDGW